MDGITLKVEGTLTAPLEELREELPRAEKRALYRAAYFLRDKIRQSLSSSLPKAHTLSRSHRPLPSPDSCQPA